MDKACSLDEARAAKAPAAEAFGRLAEVLGVGITRIGKGYGLKVNLSRLPRVRVHCPAKSSAFPSGSKSLARSANGPASPRIQRRSLPENNRNVIRRTLANQPDDAKWMTCSAKKSSAIGTI